MQPATRRPEAENQQQHEDGNACNRHGIKDFCASIVKVKIHPDDVEQEPEEARVEDEEKQKTSEEQGEIKAEHLPELRHHQVTRAANAFENIAAFVNDDLCEQEKNGEQKQRQEKGSPAGQQENQAENGDGHCCLEEAGEDASETGFRRFVFDLLTVGGAVTPAFQEKLRDERDNAHGQYRKREKPRVARVFEKIGNGLHHAEEVLLVIKKLGRLHLRQQEGAPAEQNRTAQCSKPYGLQAFSEKNKSVREKLACVFHGREVHPALHVGRQAHVFFLELALFGFVSGVNCEVKNDDCEASKNEKRPQPVRCPGVAGEVALGEASENEQWHHAHHEAEAPPGGQLEGALTGQSARENKPPSHRQARCSRNDDAGNLERAVQPNGQERLPEQPFFDEKILKSAEHDAVVNQHADGADAVNDAQDEGAEGYQNIVQGDAEEHVELPGFFVHGHRVAGFDVLLGHFHVLAAENGFEEIRLCPAGQHADDHGQREDEERDAQVEAGIVNEAGQGFSPEFGEVPAPRFFVFVNIEENLLGKAVEIDPHGAVGVKSAGIRKVVRHLHEEFVELFGVVHLPLQQLLKLLPFFLILLDEGCFTHF